MVVEELEEVDEDSLYEHVYNLFISRVEESSQMLGLGYVARSDILELPVGNRDLEIKQSLSMLNSSKESSTTGAVAWRVSPAFTEWLLDESCVLHQSIVGSSKKVVELGAGCAGIVASMIGPKVNKYIATDQEHLLKLLNYNIIMNTKNNPLMKRKKNAPVGSITTCEYDWEHLETVGNFISDIERIGSDGVIIACDTIYNDFLIPHFVQALSIVARAMGEGAHIIIAQQLRTHEILESFLSQLLSAGFKIFSVQDNLLSERLRNGFTIHYLQLS